MFRDPDFLTFFEQSTPLPEIGELKIGSRPTKRKNSERSKICAPSHGCSPGRKAAICSRPGMRRGRVFRVCARSIRRACGFFRNVQGCPFFRMLMDNLQMALAKADLVIAKEYVPASDPKEGESNHSQIEEEYERTQELILAITGQKEILDNVPVIQESIRLRNPYVDPLSFIQVDLLGKLRLKKKRSRRKTKRKCWSRFSSPSTELPQGSGTRADPSRGRFFLSSAVQRIGNPVPGGCSILDGSEDGI